MCLAFKLSSHSERLLRILDHGLPFLNMLSKASRIVGAILPSSTAMLRMSIKNSYGFRSFGQRMLQVEHVVQLHNSFCGCMLSLPMAETSCMYLLTFKRAFFATGQHPVHIPHWMHSRSLCFWTSSWAFILWITFE